MRAGNTGGAYRTMSVSTIGPVTPGAGVLAVLEVDDGAGELTPGGVAPPVHHTFPYELRQPGVRVLDGEGVAGGGELLDGDAEGVAAGGEVTGGLELGDGAGVVTVGAGSGGGAVCVGAGADVVGELVAVGAGVRVPPPPGRWAQSRGSP